MNGYPPEKDRVVGVVYEGGLRVANFPNQHLIARVNMALREGRIVKVLSTDLNLQGQDDGKGGTHDITGGINAFCQSRFGQTFPIVSELEPGMVILACTPNERKTYIDRRMALVREALEETPEEPIVD